MLISDIKNINSRIYFSRFRFFSYLLFFLCPALAFPILLYGAYHRKRYALYLLAIFMGICALVLIPPRGDLYRHAVLFYEISNYSWHEFLELIKNSVKFDFLLYGIFYIYSHIGIPFGWIRFALVGIGYLLFFKIYYFLGKDNSLPYNRKLFFIIFLLVPFSALAVGMRFGFAIVLLVFFYFKHYMQGKKSLLDFLWPVLAIYFHFGTLPIVLLILLNCYIPQWIGKRIYLHAALLLFIFSGSLISGLFYILPFDERLISYLDSYISGKYADVGYVDGMNFFYWLPTYINNSFILVIIYYLFKAKRWDPKIKFLCVFLVFLSLIFFSFAVFARYRTFFVLISTVIIIEYEKRINLLLYSLIFVFVLNMYASRRDLLINHWQYLFLPLPCMYNADYSEQWIYDNIDADGSPHIFNK